MDDLISQYNTILFKYFGYKELKEEQFEIINQLLSGRDVCAILTTGYGKSICYQMVYLITKLSVIVVSPLISLMSDQEEHMKKLGIPVTCLNSNNKFKKSEMNDILSGNNKIIYVSPEFLTSCEDFIINLTSMGNLALIAIDESHCISTWGHDFRPSYTQLKILKDWSDVPILAVTATATKKVRADVCNILKLNNPYIVIGKFDRPNLYISVSQKSKNIINDIEPLLKKYKDEYSIIYCKSKKDTDNIMELVNNLGIKCEAYHAGMSNDDRNDVQIKYTKGEIKCISATVAFGMGISIPNIRLIIHYGCPKNLESYYQEIGRAGRDGKDAECYLFYSSQDFIINKIFIESITDPQQKLYQEAHAKKIKNFVISSECRRKLLLQCFDELTTSNKCPNCDNCKKNKYNLKDFTIDSYKLLSVMIQFGNGRGAQFYIDLLRGSKNKKVISFKNNLYYGVGYSNNADYWKNLIKLLNHFEYIDEKKITGTFGSTIFCTAKAKDWLKNMNNIYTDLLFGENVTINDKDKIMLPIKN